MTPRTDKTPFFASHATNPRGRGLWFFELRGDSGNTEFMKSGLFSEALRAAQAEARRLNAHTVAVQP